MGSPTRDLAMEAMFNECMPTLEAGARGTQAQCYGEMDEAIRLANQRPLHGVEKAVMENLAASEAVADMVTLPGHYARYAIEPIHFICANHLDFFQGNIIKYICRHDAKNGLEDIRKAIRYAVMYEKFLGGDPDWWKA